jgi:hypothetical protein
LAVAVGLNRQKGTSQEVKMENITTATINDVPTVRKQIGKTTYIVRVHFSETAQETMQDKIKRMLREEVKAM